MAERLAISPAVLRWARRRSGRSLSDLRKFPVEAWEDPEGAAQPTMRQLEEYARATRTPFGLLFLAEPPGPETVPIPDFRTFGGDSVRPAPSPDLLDTIYACQQRQDWFRDFAEETGVEPVALAGSASLDTPVEDAAGALRTTLGFGLDQRVEFSNWSEALTGLRDHAEEAGVMVMISGVVGNNTHRVLSAQEFRGFALADNLAPVVFVNGADTKAAQIFTLAHELAHISLGGSAVSNAELSDLGDGDRTERWCNEVAADLLVPRASLQEAFQPDQALTGELERLAKVYRSSTLVILRRLADVGLMRRDAFHRAYEAELDRIMALTSEKGSGGSFYTTTPVRVSKRFARALITDTIEGRTSYREASRLLGARSQSSFEELSRGLGVVA